MSSNLNEIKQEIHNGQFCNMAKLAPTDSRGTLHKTSVTLKILGSKDSEAKYEDRSAVRVIIQNTKSTDPKIAIMFSNKFGCYKLPGGGIKQADVDEGIRTGENTHHITAKRESKEETGIEVGDFHQRCCGVVEEWRGDLHQMNFLCCVDARIEGGKRQLDDAEMGDLEKFEWVGFLEVVEMMSKVDPVGEIGKSIKERDLFFVKTFATFETG